MKRNDFAEYVTEDLLAGLGVSARAMFGGYGLYRDGVIFGIIADDTLYFKVGDSNRAQYEAAGSRPFSYGTARGKKAVMSYWEVPARVLEDRKTAAAWAEESRALSAAVKPPKKK